MFLEKVIKRNPELVRCAFALHREGKILPDTYVLDLDCICENARKMKEEADRYGIELYFMLKQIGRNPLVAQKLMEAIANPGAYQKDEFFTPELIVRKSTKPFKR